MSSEDRIEAVKSDIPPEQRIGACTDALLSVQIIQPSITAILRAGLALGAESADRHELFDERTLIDSTHRLALEGMDAGGIPQQVIDKVVNWCDAHGIVVVLPGNGREPGAWYSGVSYPIDRHACVYGMRGCLMPGPHSGDECHDVEMYEASMEVDE